MKTGQYISGIGHGGLILWVLLGGVFIRPSEPQPFEVAEVTLMSAAEFAALTQDVTAEPQPPVPDAPPPPPRPSPPPEPAPEPTPAPEPAPTPEPEPAPVPEPPAPEPEPIPAPEPEPAPPTPDVADLLPVVPDVAPSPPPAPRVAPEPVTEPSEQPEIADERRPEVSPDADTPEVAEELPPAAPQESTTEIVTEADRPAGMTSSPRPQPRPARPTPPVVAEAPAPTPEPTPTPTPTPAPTPEPTPAPSPEPSAADNAAADILAALSEQTAPAAPAAPAGPPLSAGERESLRVAVQQCWNVDIGAEWANVIVTVAMSMNPDGTVQANSLRMISAEGGSAGAAEQAFQAARRAILRCQQSGYSLPADKYAHWQNIEMTFNPERMRLR